MFRRLPFATFRHAHSSAFSDAKALNRVFKNEIDAVKVHSYLLNQNTPSQLIALADVKPMVKSYTNLLSVHNAGVFDTNPAQLIVGRLCNAIHGTVRDSSPALRRLPQAERRPRQLELYANLLGALKVVSDSIISHQVRINMSSLTKMFAAYQVVGPRAGVEFFRKLLQERRAGRLQFAEGPFPLHEIGAAIRCEVMCNVPIEEIEEGVKKEFGDDINNAPPLVRANLAFAYFKYGRPEQGTALAQPLIEKSNELPSSLVSFVLNTLVGDAPYSIAIKAFKSYPDQMLFHASVARMLERAFEEKIPIAEQIEVFREYLGRQGATVRELDVKIISSALVANVLRSSPRGDPDQLLPSLIQICKVYDEKMPSHTVFLNIILTELLRRWPKIDEAQNLLRVVLKSYDEADDKDFVSLRVRLNALSLLSNSDADVQRLWQLRKSPSMPRLDKLDWLALVRGSRNSSFFKTEWENANRPFESDVKNFCRAHALT